MKLQRNNHRGGLGNKLLLVVLLFIGYVGALIAPEQWVYYKMKKVLKDTALTYQVTGSMQSAQYKYESILKEEHIPLYIKDRDCLFHEGKSQLSIECEWIAPITLVLPGKKIDLSRSYRRYIAINSQGIIDEY